MNIIITTLIFNVVAIFCTNISEETVYNYEVEYEWTFVNFTWESEEMYNDAIKTQRYIPGNIVTSGIKFYKNKIYFSMPKMCNKGTPVALGYISHSDDTPKVNPLVTPFPDWNTYDLTNHTCDKLESVGGLEIDSTGIMWVLDGFRRGADPRCPPKLVLFDINDNPKIVHTFTFPDKISLSKGGFLNDIVVDESDEVFAYISDISYIDPGLIVYSKKKNRAWKLRDATMYPEPYPSQSPKVGINGMALSPKSHYGSRRTYYTSTGRLGLYSIDTIILKNEELCSVGSWRWNVTSHGDKEGYTDGMLMDNRGNLYYGYFLNGYGLARWNIYEPISASQIVERTDIDMIWFDNFTIDDKGYLYAISVNNAVHLFFGSDCMDSFESKNVKFFMLKYFVESKSYIY